MKMRRTFILAFACLAVELATCGNAKAHTRTLSDQNTTVDVALDDNFGMGPMVVDGQSSLHRQQFWYGIGNSREHAVGNLSLLNVAQPAANLLSVLYGHSLFSVEINYALTGGSFGSGYASITEQIKITNLSNDPLDFHFFQYVDFDLGGSHLGDTLYLQQDLMGLYNSVFQNKGTFYFADEIISPGANRGQVDELSDGLDIIHSLNNSSQTTLNNDAGPVNGDVAWGLQWDQSIAVGGFFQISITKSAYTTPVPEPSVMALVAAGLLAGSMLGRFGSKK